MTDPGSTTCGPRRSRRCSLRATPKLDVVAVSRYGRSRGYDLLVRLHAEGQQETSELAVEAKGVRRETTGRAGTSRIRIDPGLVANADLPLVLFVFDVDNETGFYRWLKEPVVTEEGRAILLNSWESSPPANGHRPAPIRWTDLPPLDEAALETILRRVAKWSSARD